MSKIRLQTNQWHCEVDPLNHKDTLSWRDAIPKLHLAISYLCYLPYIREEGKINQKSKKSDKDQELKQSDTTLDPGYHMEGDRNSI